MRATSSVFSILTALALGGAALLVVPTVALAGETESRSLFATGRELRLAGKCEEAIPMFRRAMETYPEGLGALRNVAECEEELGRFASARRSYWDLRLAALQTTASKYAGWDKEAEDAHARLGSQVAKVTITFGGERPEGLVIRFNGKPFDPRLVGVEIEQDNGPLEVSVAFGASPPLTRIVQVVTAGRHLVEFDLAELPRQPTGPTPGGAPGDSAESGPSAMKIGGFVALGVGGAGLIGSIVTGVLVQSSLGKVKDVCPDYETRPCPSTVADDVATGETSALLFNVFTATAIVGAGVGVTLLLLAPGDAEAAPTARAALSVAPLPGGAFVGLGGAL